MSDVPVVRRDLYRGTARFSDGLKRRAAHPS